MSPHTIDAIEAWNCTLGEFRASTCSGAAVRLCSRIDNTVGEHSALQDAHGAQWNRLRRSMSDEATMQSSVFGMS